MSREALQESLSAVMDNEADELELRRVLNAVDDAETRATWSRYGLPAQPCTRSCCCLTWISPRRCLQRWLTKPCRPRSRKAHGAALAAAVAASVTLAVLAGVRMYNRDEITGAELAAQQPAQQGLSVPQAQGPAVLAGYSESSEQPTGPMANGVLQNQAGWDQRLPGYLRQHAQESALKGTETALPYARAASLKTVK